MDFLKGNQTDPVEECLVHLRLWRLRKTLALSDMMTPQSLPPQSKEGKYISVHGLEELPLVVNKWRSEELALETLLKSSEVGRSKWWRFSTGKIRNSFDPVLSGTVHPRCAVQHNSICTTQSMESGDTRQQKYFVSFNGNKMTVYSILDFDIPVSFSEELSCRSLAVPRPTGIIHAEFAFWWFCSFYIGAEYSQLRSSVRFFERIEAVAGSLRGTTWWVWPVPWRNLQWIVLNERQFPLVIFNHPLDWIWVRYRSYP